jgi:transposase
LTRLWGRAERGKRILEAVPRNYGANTSVIGTIGLNGVEAVMTIKGSVDTLVFNAYLEEVLRPTLREGETIVLDNLGAHRASRIEEIAGTCDARVLWLSPYSPDFSPIELMWSKLKTLCRGRKPRTDEMLEEALNWSFKQITKEDCRNWFRHCGYQVALI